MTLLGAITVVLAVLLAVGVAIWLNERGGCWPWQETSSRAGGTFCDGKPSRYGSG